MKNKISALWLMLFLFGISFIYMYSNPYPPNPYPPNPYPPNPYPSPPLIRGIPINIPTNIGYVPPPLARNIQLGILSGLKNRNRPRHDNNNNKVNDKILPLMGYPLFANRNKWRYYAMSDQNNSIQLPIIKNCRSCTDEYGCDMLYDGDRVYVEGYDQVFKVTLYDTNNLTYLPLLS